MKHAGESGDSVSDSTMSLTPCPHCERLKTLLDEEREHANALAAALDSLCDAVEGEFLLGPGRGREVLATHARRRSRVRLGDEVCTRCGVAATKADTAWSAGRIRVKIHAECSGTFVRPVLCNLCGRPTEGLAEGDQERGYICHRCIPIAPRGGCDT